MNIDTFNAAFPSYEKTFLEEKKIQKQNEKQTEENKRRIKFMEQFRNIFFNDLKKQTDNIITNDGCIHYKHIYTGKIYSWVFRSNKNEWIINDDMNDRIKAKLFS